MFYKGVANIVGIYFPLLLEDKYMQIVRDEYLFYLLREIVLKVTQIKETINKHWTEISRHLCRNKEETSSFVPETQGKRSKNCKISSYSTCVLQKWLL